MCMYINDVHARQLHNFATETCGLLFGKSKFCDKKYVPDWINDRWDIMMGHMNRGVVHLV